MESRNDYLWHENWPEFVEKTVNVPNLSLSALIHKTAEKHPDRIAMDFLGKTYTFADLDRDITRFATYLQSIGFKKGDVCCLFLPNIPQFAIAYFGVLKAGGIVTGSNPLNSAHELHYQLNDSGSTIIVGFENFHGVIEEGRKGTKVETVIYTGVGEALKKLKGTMYNVLKRGRANKPKLPDNEKPVYFFDLLKDSALDSLEFKPVNISKDDVAVIQYTGGTTGTSKGATLSHANLMANCLQIAEWIKQIRRNDEIIVYAAILPFYHSYGMSTLLNNSLVNGDKLILVPNPRDIALIFKLIKKQQVQFLLGVPTLFIAMINYIREKKPDVSSLRIAISGAAPLPEQVARDFYNVTQVLLVEGYGLSEASPVTHFNPLDGNNKDGTIGIPLPSTEAKIVDTETGKEQPVGEPGELWIRGPQVMQGYWNKKEETDNVKVDDWLKTGDVAVVDDNGYFSIVDRIKDMINVSGYKIYPREMEDVFYTHPDVDVAAVIGVPDEYRGEKPKVFLKLKPGSETTEEEFKIWAKDKVAKYKRPDDIEIKEDIPVTIVGKVLRRELRDYEMSKQEQ